MKSANLLAVMAASRGDAARAAALAAELGLDQLPPATETVGSCFACLLVVEGEGLYLQQTGKGAPGPVRVDFEGAAMRHRRRGGHNELLGRAVGVGRRSPLKVLDATAGLGRDSFVLADLGVQVLMCEREPVLWAMLRSALDSISGGGDDWLAGVATRLSLHRGDSRDLPRDILAGRDVIYLDPMFPGRHKSAAVKKEMALVQKLLQGGHPAADDEDLLAWALQQPVLRVVVKRPPRAATLGGHRPSSQMQSKAVRYDIYTLASWD